MRLSRTGLLPKVERDRCSGLGSPCSSGPQAGAVGDMPYPARGPGHALPPTFPSAGPLPSTPSAAVHHGFVRALHRYYEPVRFLACSPTASSHGDFLSRPGIAVATAGQTRPPRFRRVPFRHDVVSDPGRATAPRITAPHMLPSTILNASASAKWTISGLNTHPTRLLCTLRDRRRRRPRNTRYRAPATAYSGRSFTGWNPPALPGAQVDCHHNCHHRN